MSRKDATIAAGLLLIALGLLLIYPPIAAIGLGAGLVFLAGGFDDGKPDN